MNVDERMKEIIEGFSKLGLEEMERILIKLGIPTDRKIGSDKNGREKICQMLKEVLKE